MPGGPCTLSQIKLPTYQPMLLLFHIVQDIDRTHHCPTQGPRYNSPA
jgi:hypothetical protein